MQNRSTVYGLSLIHIYGALLLGGKNLFQKTAHQFGRTVESIQIGFHVVPQVVVLVAPTNGLLLGGGKFFFQAAVLHVHHIAMVGLLFQLGKSFFGQRVVAEEGALADIIQDVYKRQRPYRLFEVRTQFFQMRTEQSSSHCANLIVALPQETFPLGEPSKSPLHFAAHRDESVIAVSYTHLDVYKRQGVQ